MSKKKAAASANRRAKAAKNKTVKKRERLTPRQSKLLQGIVEGKSVHRSALDAGYSATTAHNPGDLLDTVAMRDALNRLLVPIEKIAQRINEGLDAEKTEFAKFEGRITDEVNCVDFEQRRRYAELAARLKGLDPGIQIDPGSKPPASITVNFVHVASVAQP